MHAVLLSRCGAYSGARSKMWRDVSGSCLSVFSYVEQIIFDIIGVEPKGFDEIQTETELNTEDLLICLTGMELRGLIEQIEGDRYKRA